MFIGMTGAMRRCIAHIEDQPQQVLLMHLSPIVDESVPIRAYPRQVLDHRVQAGKRALDHVRTPLQLPCIGAQCADI